MQPVKPERLDPFAAAFLAELQREPAAEAFILGGYFALKHYLDYRETADVDAWWRSREEPVALDAARRALTTAARAVGYEVRERRWGETISLEALDGARKVFSFQVAVRSVELEAPLPSPWGAVAIETLDDNVASKMQALVARGAPRDFVDIKAVVDAGLLTVGRCWELFAAKRSGMTIDDARLRVQAHLMRIEARLPLDRVPEERRSAAAALRSWFRERFTTSDDA